MKYLITRISIFEDGKIKSIDADLETDNIESTRKKLIKETNSERINFIYEERDA